jgi:hypothetical protein
LIGLVFIVVKSWPRTSSLETMDSPSPTQPVQAAMSQASVPSSAVAPAQAVPENTAPTPSPEPVAAPAPAENTQISAGDDSAAPGDTWRDASTGLIWSKKDNGKVLVGSWQAAKNYCETLELDNTTGWRLPTYGELNSVRKGASLGRIHVGRNGAFFWSATVGNDSLAALANQVSIESVGIIFTGGRGGRSTMPLEGPDDKTFTHALCVHD